MDSSNTKYRIRQCSGCSDGLEYFCVTCSSDLCLLCSKKHLLNTSGIGEIHDVITYREKSIYLKNQELCLRDQNSVYDNYCEFCNIPICFGCTELSTKHGKHKTTDIGTAYETKRRQTKATIHKIQIEELFCLMLWPEIDLEFKFVSKNAANINSELLILSKKLTGCIESLINNFPAEMRCLKQKIKMKKCIASIQTYEHVYEHSSIVPIKFLLSVKKTHPSKMNNRKFLKHHSKATLRESTSMEYLIEKMPTIKLTSKEKGIQSTTSDMSLREKIHSYMLTLTTNIVLKTPQSISTYLKCLKIVMSERPNMLKGALEWGL